MIDEDVIVAAARAFVGSDFMDESEREAVVDGIREAAPIIRAAALAEPRPMVLHCPECRARHIDEGEFATKPHHTHACQACSMVWRPSVEPTVGVRFLPGFKNEDPRGPGVVESHWIQPSPAAAARPREATSTILLSETCRDCRHPEHEGPCLGTVVLAGEDRLCSCGLGATAPTARP